MHTGTVSVGTSEDGPLENGAVVFVSSPEDRPDVASRGLAPTALRGMLLALPVSLGFWAGIAWLVIRTLR
jgi:hypothetical protein